MRILALDLGIKSLGIALSDPTNLIAIPQENFFFERERIDLPLAKVSEYLDKYEISLVLLGFPLRTTGELATIALFIERFAVELKQIVKVKLVDERFSTKRAFELLANDKNKNKPKKKFEQEKDMWAAYLLLKDYS